jgi:hypothetical protein
MQYLITEEELNGYVTRAAYDAMLQTFSLKMEAHDLLHEAVADLPPATRDEIFARVKELRASKINELSATQSR